MSEANLGLGGGMPKLIIGNKNYSSWSLRPWLLLRQFGVPFEEVKLSLDTAEFHRRIHGLSPSGRVPALHVGDEVVWDSLAICEVANERWLDGRGWPQQPTMRALARSATAEMHSSFAALRGQLPMNCRRQPSPRHWDEAAERDIERVHQLWTTLRRQHGHAGNFLCGPFGIVDAMFAPVCVRFRAYGVVTDAVSEAYVEAMYSLPAMREWLAEARGESEQLAATDSVGLAVGH